MQVLEFKPNSPSFCDNRTKSLVHGLIQPNSRFLSKVKEAFGSKSVTVKKKNKNSSNCFGILEVYFIIV